MFTSPWQKPFRGMQINKAHPLARGLVGCWVINEVTGGIIVDLNGSKNTGVLGVGTTWSPNYLSLVGASGTIAFDNIKLLENDKFTVMFGGTCDVAYGSSASYFYFGTGGDYLKIQHAAWNHGYNVIEYNGYTGAILNGNTTIDDGSYHNVVYQRTATDNRNLFIDGILDTNDTTTVATETSNVRQFNIAGITASNWGLHYIYIYDRALSFEEVAWLDREPYAMFQQLISPALLYYEAAPPTGNPFWYYQMLRRRN